MLARIAKVVACALVVSAVACGSNGDGPVPEGTPSPTPSAPSVEAGTALDASSPDGARDIRTANLDATASRVAAALCGFHERCFETYVRDVMPTPAKCVERYAAAFRATHFGDAVFSETDVDAMVACESSLGCEALYGGKWQTECRSPRPTNGRKTAEPCVSDLSCASEACVTSTVGSCGRCAERIVASVGEPCGDGAARCGTGLTCLSSKRCVAVRHLGETCDTAQSLCGNGLTCRSGQCGKLPTAGEACDARAGCDPYRLAGCNTSGTCEAVTYLAAGAPCEPGALSTCGKGEVCATSTDGGTGGACTPRRTTGQSCRRSQECELFATCTRGLCEDPKGPACAK
jgi:hypothetical protein